jgi:WD40 repeat protein
MPLIMDSLMRKHNAFKREAFSPDGKTLVSGSGGPQFLIWLWDVRQTRNE